MTEMLANATVMIILLYINVSNHYVVYLKFTKYYTSTISQFKTTTTKGTNG